jgi:hypothetical protein
VFQLGTRAAFPKGFSRGGAASVFVMGSFGVAAACGSLGERQNRLWGSKLANLYYTARKMA